MEHVTHLNLGGNPIERGWEHLGSLRQLRKLGLACCGLTELPAALAGMESMTRLDLIYNSIGRGWERLRPLRQLRELKVDRGEEINILEAVKALKHLTILHF